MPEESNHRHNCLEELRADHEIILKELNTLEKDFGREQVEKFLEFTENFAEPHHRKEENVFFPELEKKGIPREGGPIGVMLLEHEMKRNHVKELAGALAENDEGKMRENSQAIISLLRDHIFKENNILYPMAEQVLTGEELLHLGHRCHQIE